MPPPFIAHFQPWRRLAALALCAGFVALSLWEAGAIGRLGADAVPWIGWPGALLFGGFGLVGLFRIAWRGPALRVDAAGLWLWRPGGGVDIPWSAVLAMAERDVRRQRFLSLWVDAPERYRARGWLGRANAGLGFGDVAVGVQGTDRRFAELLAAVAAFAPEPGQAPDPEQ